MNSIEQLSINTIRVLSAEAVEKAKSGHPGAPLGAAPMAYTLWARHMNTPKPLLMIGTAFCYQPTCFNAYLFTAHLGYDLPLKILRISGNGSKTPAILNMDIQP